MSLFESGHFILHSGSTSTFKIDCDALTVDDWESLAALVNRHYDFGMIVPILRGGLRFAEALEQYIDPKSQNLLIVDDVLTTGNSMQTKYQELLENAQTAWRTKQGIVAFARGQCPEWVTPIFQMWVKG